MLLICSADLNVEVHYSTPSLYFAAVRESALAAAIKFPVQPAGRDFFPYADNKDSYWTGYYVSRPLLKGECRRTYATVRSAEVLFALTRQHSLQWCDHNTTSGEVDCSDSYDWRAAFHMLEDGRLNLALGAFCRLLC